MHSLRSTKEAQVHASRRKLRSETQRGHCPAHSETRRVDALLGLSGRSHKRIHTHEGHHHTARHRKPREVPNMLRTIPQPPQQPRSTSLRCLSTAVCTEFEVGALQSPEPPTSETRMCELSSRGACVARHTEIYMRQLQSPERLRKFPRRDDEELQEPPGYYMVADTYLPKLLQPAEVRRM